MDNHDSQLSVPVLLILGLLTTTGFIDTRLWLLFTPLVLLLLIRFKNILTITKLGITDYAILIIGVTELCLIPFSRYAINSINSFQCVVSAILLWFILRFLFYDQTIVYKYIFWLSIAIGLTSTVTLLQYVSHRNCFFEFGYTDMTMIRQYYHPLGFVSNDWVAISLCLLPFPFYAYLNAQGKYAKFIHLISLIIATTSIFISFSRSGYIAVFLFYFFSFILAIRFGCQQRRKLSVSMISVIIVSAIILIPDRDSISTTLSFSKTTVQKRSVKGRFLKWKEAIELYKTSPITGVGGGNFALESAILNNRDSDSLTNRSTNSYLQLLAEKGTIGFVVYLASLILVLITCLKSASRSFIPIPFVSAFMVFCFREFFFSSFFVEKRLSLLVILVMFFATYSQNRQSGQFNKISGVILLIVGIAELLTNCQQFKIMSAEQFNRRACETSMIDPALNYEKRAVEKRVQNPVFYANMGCLFAIKANLNIEMLQNTSNNNTQYIDSAIFCFEKAIEIRNDEPLFQFNKALLLSLKEKDNDAMQILSRYTHSENTIFEILCVAGMIEERNGHITSAEKLYAQAIAKSPAITESQFFFDLTDRFKSLAQSSISIAYDQLQSIYSENHDPITAARLGKLMLYLEDYDNAELMFRKALSQLPTLDRPLYYLGCIYEIKGDKLQAIEYYKKAKRLDPSDLLPLKQLANYGHLSNYSVESLEKNKISNYAYDLQDTYCAKSLRSPYVIDNFEQYFEPKYIF